MTTGLYKGERLGSPYDKLPAVLSWFTANIGLYHIHHLSLRIPNPYLPKLYTENPSPRWYARAELVAQHEIAYLPFLG